MDSSYFLNWNENLELLTKKYSQNSYQKLAGEVKRNNFMLFCFCISGKPKLNKQVNIILAHPGPFLGVATKVHIPGISTSIELTSTQSRHPNYNPSKQVHWMVKIPIIRLSFGGIRYEWGDSPENPERLTVYNS
jgi:hypothetical protein